MLRFLALAKEFDMSNMKSIVLDDGPGGVLYKSNDFSLTAYHGQLANNVPCYGLSNLVHGKESYYTYNGVDWTSFGTLASGIDINFFNEDYAETFKHIIEFVDVSTKYIKICCLTSGGPFDVRDVLVYFGNDNVSVRKLYHNEVCGTSALTNEFTGEIISFSTSYSIGVELYDVEPINKIVLISNRSDTFTLSIYVSSTNLLYYYHEDKISSVVDNVAQFVIDLENRHNLEFIRSYGSGGGGSQIPASDTKTVFQRIDYWDGAYDPCIVGVDKNIYTVYRDYDDTYDQYNLIFHKSTDKGTSWPISYRKIVQCSVFNQAVIYSLCLNPYAVH